MSNSGNSCPRHSNSTRSKSLSPVTYRSNSKGNSAYSSNPFQNVDGTNYKGRRGSPISSPDYDNYAAPVDDVNNHNGVNADPNMAQLTAQAFNSYRASLGKTQHNSRSSRGNSINAGLGDGAGTFCNQNSKSSQSYSGYNSAESEDSQQQQRQSSQDAPQTCRGIPMKVVLNKQQAGTLPPIIGEMMWSTTSEEQECCNCTMLTNWCGEKEFCVGGTGGACKPGMVDVTTSFDSGICDGSTELNLALQVKPRFRGGGNGRPCCNQPDCNGGGGGGGGGGAPNQQGGASFGIPSGGYSQGSHQVNGGPQPSMSGLGGKSVSMTLPDGSYAEPKDNTPNLERFEFPSPDSLRTKLFEYIENRPKGPKPVGKLKPFKGHREDAISCKTCYTPEDENSLPAGCQPCGRLDLTATDFAAEEAAAEARMKAEAAAEERKKVMAELDRYKKTMPADFTCDEQMEYLKCLGASCKAMKMFKEIQEMAQSEEDDGCGNNGQAENNCCGHNDFQQGGNNRGSITPKQEFLQQLESVQNTTPLPDPDYRKKVLARQVMPPSQRRRSGGGSNGGQGKGSSITPIKEEGDCGGAPGMSNAGEKEDLNELIRLCREQLKEACSNQPKIPSSVANQDNIVENDYKLYQQMLQQQGGGGGGGGGSVGGGAGGGPSCGENCPKDVDAEDSGSGELVEEDSFDRLTAENKKLLEENPMFSPPKPPPERSLAETMELYKEHLANIRRRYFGEVCKFIDDVEDMTPEVAAAMVLSEDEGYTMTNAPLNMYEYLYPDSPSQPLVSIAEVTANLPRGYDDVVVPLVPPMFLDAREYPGLEDPAMLDSPRVIQIGPSMNLAEEPKITETKKPQDVAELVVGMAESGFEDPEEVAMADDEEGEGVGADIFNVKLPKSMPPHYSRMQMRGSQAPNWFPGYYFAYHTKPGVNVQRTHGSVLEQIWQDVQPDAVRPGGGALIIGE